MRTIQSVLDELREEQHVPMANLVDELKGQEWAAKLAYDLSMLRLWILRKDNGAIVAMVVYGDGRGGGRPSAPPLDAFETTLLVDSEPVAVKKGDSSYTIASLRRWFESEGKIE